MVFTGHKNELLNEQCLQAGANAVVVKTGDFEELTAARAARPEAGRRTRAAGGSSPPPAGLAGG